LWQGSTPRQQGAAVSRTNMMIKHKTSQDLRDSYELEEKVLGEGAFGTVRKGRLKDAMHIVRAVKEVHKVSLKTETQVRKEIAVLRDLDHPCICRLMETYEDSKSMYLVLEYIDGRELFDEIEEDVRNGVVFDERRAADIMKQVFGVLQYCHGRSVIHRDLKPENIMVLRSTASSESKTPEIKIIDFGLAVLCRNKSGGYSSPNVVGTPAYIAPEAEEGRSCEASDLWSVGVILFVLLLERFPEAPVQVGDNAAEAAADPDWEKGFGTVSALAGDLLRGLLRRNSLQRFTAAEASAHAWTRGDHADSCAVASMGLAALSSFSSFHRSEKLKRAALTAMATQLSGQQVQELRTQFSQIDTDGNGMISRAELLQAVQAAPPKGVLDVEAWVDDIFDAADTDGSGEITITEWEAGALQSLECMSDECIRAAFRVFDADGDGSISQEELQRICDLAPEELGNFDLNGDGVLDFEEFKAMLITPRDLSPNQPEKPALVAF